MKQLLASCAIAFSTYSRIPMPQVEWNEKNMRFTLFFFPLVGAAVGAALWLWLRLALWLGLGNILTGAVAVFVPIAVSGGIHLDGFCDTCDALGSHQDRARKLEILKDPRIGAFGVMGCVLYLLIFFAAWCQIALSPRIALLLAAGPVLSRGLSGLFAVTLPNARGSGLLAAFTAPADKIKARILLSLWTAAAGTALLGIDWRLGLPALLGAGLACLYYVAMSRRQFGGITGDLAGFFLQLCELGMVLAVALAQRLWEGAP